MYKINIIEQQTIIELKKLNKELKQLIDKFNQITIQ